MRGAGFGLLFILGIFVFGLITQLLWNNLVTVIFHGPVISYWQALGLMILARILTGGFRRGGHGGWGCHCGGHCGGGYGGNHWKMHWKRRLNDKIANMSPEEREKFIANLKNSCCYYPEEEKS
jgi:hypothetical protein